MKMVWLTMESAKIAFRSLEDVDPLLHRKLESLRTACLSSDERWEILLGLWRDRSSCLSGLAAVPFLLEGHPSDPRISWEMATMACTILSLAADPPSDAAPLPFRIDGELVAAAGERLRQASAAMTGGPD